jgi:hypothetical protein
LIVFDLLCTHGHAFEGWFASAEDYERQLLDGLLSCPSCDSRSIEKRPSAPHLNLGHGHAPVPVPATGGARGRARADAQRGANLPSPPVGVHAAALPEAAAMQALLLKMAREIAERTEDVGDRFAEEARRIHYDEVPSRGIRGVTTPQEAAALIDEGIAVVPLPFGLATKGPLQ